MAKTKDQKVKIIKNAEKAISDSKIVIFTDYSKMTVSEMRELRDKVEQEKNEYKVIKNALLDLAAKSQGFEFKTKETKKPVAVIFGYSDEVMPAKALVEFIKETEKPEIIGGYYQGEYITKEQVEALSKIPSRNELEAKLVGTIAGPVSGMVNVLSANLRGLVSVLNQYQGKKS
jgi:large subunit ribosomal protein L10